MRGGETNFFGEKIQKGNTTKSWEKERCFKLGRLKIFLVKGKKSGVKGEGWGFPFDRVWIGLTSK